jgi:hypothetical protein
MTKDTAPAVLLLAKKEASSAPHPPRALEHLAFAILMEGGADTEESLSALARLRRHFVDWNEIRVARTQELAKAMGDTPNAERAALRIKEEYNAFFEKKGVLSYEFLAAGKPVEMRRVLNQLLPHLAKSAGSLLLYEFCAGATLPLSDAALKQAKKDGAVGKSADKNQAARILSESMEPGEIALLAQYWELETSGNPYGEAGKKEVSAVKKKKPAKRKK